MMRVRQLLEEALRAASYRERRGSVYEASNGRRTVVLIEASNSPADWAERIETALRFEIVRAAPSWSRYVIIILDSPKSAELSTAAAAFCRDVSKCRRLVAFEGQAANEVLPFLGLPAVPGGGGTSVQDVDQIVMMALVSEQLAVAFMDGDFALTKVQQLAEDTVEDV